MNIVDRRAFIDAVAALPAEHRAWLASDDPELFAYYGWGVVLNEAQVDAFNALLRWPPGSIHLWRWANRTGKTTALVVAHLYAVWKKWRYLNEDFEDWLDYKYRTLHSAPLNKLAGKAWELVEGLVAGSTWQQRDPTTNRQRRAILTDFFTPKSGRAPDGSEILWVDCANGGLIDFISTQGGAARMESEAWWLISWDEFVRQAPVGDIPLLFDQTFLPRSSDFMAPVILAGTVTEDAEPIYAELEDLAAENKTDWNVMSFGREVNFSQTQDSMDRQRRLSIDPAIAARSLEGKIGEGGRGTLFPHLLLRTAFDPKMPTDHSEAQIKGFHDRGFAFISAFDHAAKGDLNVVTTIAVPWPIPRGDDLIGACFGVGIAERRSGSHLTPTLQAQFCLDEVDRYDSRIVIVDATAEGGQLVARAIREELPNQTVDCIFNAKRPGARATNKEMGLQSLQRMFAWGLDTIATEEGWLDEFPHTPVGSFGLFRLPLAGRWLKLHRELAVLRRDDEKQHQDRAMTLVMVAWYLEMFVGSIQSVPTAFSMVGRKARRRRPVMLVR